MPTTATTTSASRAAATALSTTVGSGGTQTRRACPKKRGIVSTFTA